MVPVVWGALGEREGVLVLGDDWNLGGGGQRGSTQQLRRRRKLMVLLVVVVVVFFIPQDRGVARSYWIEAWDGAIARVWAPSRFSAFPLWTRLGDVFLVVLWEEMWEMKLESHGPTHSFRRILNIPGPSVGKYRLPGSRSRWRSRAQCGGSHSFLILAAR